MHTNLLLFNLARKQCTPAPSKHWDPKAVFSRNTGTTSFHPWMVSELSLLLFLRVIICNSSKGAYTKQSTDLKSYIPAGNPEMKGLEICPELFSGFLGISIIQLGMSRGLLNSCWKDSAAENPASVSKPNSLMGITWKAKPEVNQKQNRMSWPGFQPCPMTVWYHICSWTAEHILPLTLVSTESTEH